MEGIKTIDRRYFDVLVLAHSMREARDRGDHFMYEGMLLSMALRYHDIFTTVGDLDVDRKQLLSTLSEILPDYFRNNFDKYGQLIK